MAKAFNAGERWKKGTLHGQHTFFVHCFAVVLHDYTTSDLQKIPSYTFYGGSVVRVLVHYFLLPLIYTLHYWWPLAFLILSPLLQFFFKSPSPFFSLSFTGLPPTFSFCLSFFLALYSKFVDMTTYLSLILLTTRIQKKIPLSVFVFIDSFFVSVLQDAGGYAISRQNNLELHFSCHTCWFSYFTLVCLCCGRMVSQAGGRWVGVRSRDCQIFSDG